MSTMARKSAFSLIELLVVIVIIAVLAALLFPGIAAAQRLAKKTQAKAEVQGIAAALEAYYSDYHRWPPTSITTVPDPELNEVRINGDVARVLQGDFSTPTLMAANPKKVAYVQFKRFADPACVQPVNPWWNSGIPTTNHWFCYKVDKNFDNVISVGPASPPTTTIKRRVLVWTRNVDNGTFVTSAD